MENEFIPYEQALTLKKLGFDEPCFKIFIDNKLEDFSNEIKKHIKNSDFENKYVTAPLYQQAFRWFREKYNFDLNWKPMSMVGITCYYDIEIHHPKYVWDTPPKVTGKTYEEVELECLKKLIEIVKNK